MFCPSCGKEASTKFCRYCGTKILDEDGDQSEADRVVEDINQESSAVDVAQIIRDCNGSRISAIKKYCSVTGANLNVGKMLIDRVYGSMQFEFEIKDEQKKDDDRFPIWQPPAEYYQVHRKLYELNPKLGDVAVRYGIVENVSEVKIAYGTYYGNIDCVLIFVKGDQVVIANINDAKPGRNCIRTFNRGDSVFGDTYNDKKFKFEADDLLGFKLDKANEISTKKKYATYFEMLQVLAPEKSKSYFYKTLRLTFKTEKEVALKEQEKEKRRADDLLAYRGAVERRQAEKDREVERIRQMDREGVAYCPKCHSTSLSANKKGFGIGKAVIGGMTIGALGLVAGNMNAKKVRVTCLKCGHEFWAGQK